MSLSSLWPHPGAGPSPHRFALSGIRDTRRMAVGKVLRPRAPRRSAAGETLPMTTPDAQPTSGHDHGDHGDAARTAQGTRHEHGHALRDDESVWDARYAELD